MNAVGWGLVLLTYAVLIALLVSERWERAKDHLTWERERNALLERLDVHVPDTTPPAPSLRAVPFDDDKSYWEARA